MKLATTGGVKSDTSNPSLASHPLSLAINRTSAYAELDM
jgi:hypothetical protein